MTEPERQEDLDSANIVIIPFTGKKHDDTHTHKTGTVSDHEL